ncbi:hypothetical protein [Moorena sp. SIO4G3]|uniref:hypothetical protein n=1 Tax=Moorena sp. SIO4G3 TaxID=2607821 RepID=UPI00142B4976|nr:hypothetical protein [Moorena sp. SIO4G3]NEO79423.1 hypothetical protein [Moorena sp. SIO4G3]
MEECVRGYCLVGKWSWVRDQIAFRLVFAHPTPTECDRTLVVWWANGQAVRVQIAFRLVFAHPTEPNGQVWWANGQAVRVQIA